MAATAMLTRAKIRKAGELPVSADPCAGYSFTGVTAGCGEGCSADC